jgi:hypothetical protein
MPVFAKVQKKTNSAHLLSPSKPNLATDKPAHAANSSLTGWGNQLVQQMLRSGEIQANLTVNPSNDEYEQEANRVAEQVMRMPEPLNAEGAFSGRHIGIGIQRQCSECDEEELHRRPLEEEKILQTKPLADQITPPVQRQVRPELEEVEEEPIQAKRLEGLVQRQEEPEEETVRTKRAGEKAPQVSPELKAQILSLRGGGQPLPESMRRFFEPRFWCDFSHVIVHRDNRAAEATRALRSQAFTFGRHIVFDPRRYQPHTNAGKSLIAHELTHTIQQGGKDLYRSGSIIFLQRQPVDCTPAITGVNPPRNAVQEVNESHRLAVRFAGLARRAIASVLNGDRLRAPVGNSLNYNFSSDHHTRPNTAQLTTIRNRYDHIITRLNIGTRIFRCNRGGNCRAATNTVTLATQRCPAGGHRTRLCRDFFNLGEIERAGTMVHESAHAIGVCGDVYSNDANYPGSNPVNNAESYGEFAHAVGGLAGLPLRRRRVQIVPP